MNSLRILHVDDDPFMRDIVELALGRDTEFEVRSCEDAKEALAVISHWAPDLIILDVLMPGLDGPGVLAHLQEDPATAKIPVIFITGHTQPADRERLMALGAVAVIVKPFYPVTLADTVRRHVQSIKLAAAGYDFAQRLRADAARLAIFRNRLHAAADAPVVSDDLQACVHRLAGAAGIFKFQAVSTQAVALEDTIVEYRAGRGAAGEVEAGLEALLECIEREAAEHV